MDKDQSLRKLAESFFGREDPDFYDFEAHIMFDDAMELNKNAESEPNQFVKLMMAVIDDAATAVHEEVTRLKPPLKVPTPYGGQLIFTMPGENFLFVHMKDKNKIRHRKRWSQVMYMYYLLGFRLTRLCHETTLNAVMANKELNSGDVYSEEVMNKASNTYLLALDGDVDFTPGSVLLLLDRMRKSEKVGAACGRIHPTGIGPVVWFQMFEYAIAHWLQKSTEHVLGCVLCSPGCFSLFRGSALMDDNVMKKYTILPNEATHHLMYDQGEDRWLCTLLLQQGYRVDYVAAADAYTFAPEGFGEFFNQRRRWMPSTVANIIDLLADYKNTVNTNPNISFLYIVYQAALLLSTIIGPATVLLMIAGSNLVVFKTSLVNSYLIALAPAALYFALCFFVKPKWQIFAAEILTGFYAFIMLIVFVGTLVTAAKESPFHPSVIFLAFLVFIFAGAALLHPDEWKCVIFGILYFLLIPTGFLILNFYSLTNLHVVSWGTREVPKKKTPAEIEEEKKKVKEMKLEREKGFLTRIFPQAPLKDLKELVSNLTDIQGKKREESDNATNSMLTQISDRIGNIERQLHEKNSDDTRHKKVQIETNRESDSHKAPLQDLPHSILKKPGHLHEQDDSDESKRTQRDELVNPAWIDCKELGNGDVTPMAEKELTFWHGFITKYLAPLTLTPEQKKKTEKSLIELRNNVCLGMAMINMGWIAINFMFQLTSPTRIRISFANEQNQPEQNLEENADAALEDDAATDDKVLSLDVLGLLFIFFFLVILLLQCVGMVIHRWGTFLHLVSVTQLINKPMKQIDTENTIEPNEVYRKFNQCLKEPVQDESSMSSEDGDNQDDTKQELHNLQTKGTRFTGATGTTLRGTSRQLGAATQHTLNKRERDALQKSFKVMPDGLSNTQSRFVHAPAREAFQRKENTKYNGQKMLLNQRRNRLNLAPGRSELEESLVRTGIRQRKQRGRPLVPEEDDIIRGKGTIARRLGKRLNMMVHPEMSNQDTSSHRSHGQTNGAAGSLHRRHTDRRDDRHRSEGYLNEREYGRYKSRHLRDRRQWRDHGNSRDYGANGDFMEMH